MKKILTGLTCLVIFCIVCGLSLSVSALEDDDNKGEIREELAGDWAYITDFIMKPDDTTTSGTYVRTGTSPWDEDNEAGNDKDALNDILRSFDTVSYTFQFNTKLRDEVAQEDVGGIKQGRLYFEFVLPLGENQAQFETEAMGWLKNSQDIKYEVITAIVNGVESQVLRGSFTLIPTGSNEAAIGASTNELYVVIRALQMNHEEKIKPVFTLWLQHNDVEVTYNSEDDRLPTTIVTGTDDSCKDHDELEAATLEGTEIMISARPMFNIAIVGINAPNTTVGTYDFNATTNTSAINYGLGEVEGRLNGYGLRIELRGKDGQGMRGAEFPDTDTPITFEVTLSSAFDPTGSIRKTEEPNYLAQFWSGGGNASGNTNVDKRTVDTESNYIQGVPFNKLLSSNTYKQCYNGGTWTFEETEEGKLKVIVSDFEFHTEHFPTTYAAGNQNMIDYYDPDAVSNYWEISQAVFSSGELWIVQPFEGITGEDEGQYIASKYGAEGQFFTKLEISNLSMKTVSGAVITEQVAADPNATDDINESGQFLKSPGTIDGRVVYLKDETRTYNETLTEGSLRTDDDYATGGSGVTLESWILHDSAEGEYTGVAYDLFIKMVTIC